MPRYLGYEQVGFANTTVDVVRGQTLTVANHDSDPVSLYLPFDSDLQDASANNHTVTAYGNAALSATQSKFGGNSAYFDGTGDYLSIPSDSSLVFGSEDFTIEFFIYPSTDNLYTIFSHRDSSAGAGDWTMPINRTVTGQIEFYNGGYSISVPVIETTITGGFSGGWHHIAVTRSGNNYYLFFDGDLKSTTTDSTVHSSGPTELHIGRDNYVGGRYYFTGYLDDFRVIKGVARYTKNFIPPSQAVGATLNGTNETNTTTGFTSLYLSFDSDLNDDSPHGHTGTATGNAAISSAQSKFGGSSLYLDGSGDVVTYPRDTSFQLGAGDFTIEAWVYRTSNVSLGVVVGQWEANANRRAFILRFENHTPAFYWSTNGSGYSYQVFSDLTSSLNTWHHVAFVRSGSSGFCFLDGVKSATVANLSTSTLYYPDAPLSVGALNTLSYAGGQNNFAGYIDDLRILKGYAKYTADFVPPTSAVGTSVSETVNDLTVLYLPFDDDSFEDQARNHSVTRNGDVALNTSVKKFGTSSAYFDGTGDRIEVSHGGDLSLGSEDFTIEAWVYATSTSGNVDIIGDRINTTYGGFLFYRQGSNFQFYSSTVISDSGSWNIASAQSLGTVSLNTWTHLAVTRSGNTFRCFQDGVQQSTFTSSSTLPTGAAVGIGGRTSSDFFAGHIDDLCIIKGHAKYTTNFTPPTSALGSEASTLTEERYTDTKFLSGVWSSNEQHAKMIDGEWITNEDAGLMIPGHRWYVS